VAVTDGVDPVRTAQQLAHGAGHDYEPGSPHLKHAGLHSWLVGELRNALGGLGAVDGHEPEVLEIGGGHGTFTQTLLGAGARVTVTEMSRFSADRLRERFAAEDRVRVVYDPDGNCSPVEPVDAVLYLSVLHHIPDYVDAVRRSIALVRTGGAVVTFQDPLWYPRQTRFARCADRGSYLAWRLGQGNMRRGLSTAMRRLRGVYDPGEPSDMAEYHVVRDGVDEMALQRILEDQFDSVRVIPYWSSQAGWAQWLGERLFPANTFGIVALGRKRA
jgi:SAM-dependent methyltransferase